MNKETRNTLVYDFIGTAFCLFMAFALILMFSGCSNDESKQPVGSMGGAEEETGIYALSGRAGDIHPKLMKMHKAIASSDGLVRVKEGVVVVIIHELDSLTVSRGMPTEKSCRRLPHSARKSSRLRQAKLRQTKSTA